MVAIVITWPLSARVMTAIPLGTEPASTVPLFNAWTIWWNADSASRGFVGYWDAPIFYPTRDSFAFSEAQPITLVVAPLVWATNSLPLAYNVYLLLSLVANAWMGRRLLRNVGIDKLPAICGGLMIECLPFVHWQLGVLQLVPLWGMLWTIDAAWRFGRTPRLRIALESGVAFAATYLMYNHHGLFFSLLLIPITPILLWPCLRENRTWKLLLPGVLLSGCILAPFVVAQLRASRDHDWRRDAKLVRLLSAEWGDYTAAPWSQLIPVGDFAGNRRHIWKLSPGWLKWTLAVIGLGGGLAVKRYRRWTLVCAVLLATAAPLSMGPRFQSGFVYDWLVRIYPGMAQVRNIFRFALLVQLSAVFLAAQGLSLIADLFKHRILAVPRDSGQTARWRVRTTVALTVVIGGAAACEIWPTERKFVDPPTMSRHRGWIDWVNENTNPDEVIAFVPFPVNGTVFDYKGTAEWMYLQKHHARSMVNGYSGFFPDRFQRLKTAMRTFPDSNSLVALRKAGARYCVVDLQRIKNKATLDHQLTLVFVDAAATIAIYRLPE